MNADSARRWMMRMSMVASAAWLMVQPGCSKPVAAPPVVEQKPSPSDRSPPSVPSVAPTVATPANVPAVKKRSAESLRERIRTTVQRLQVEAEPRRLRQAWHRIAHALLDYEKQHGQVPDDEGRANDVASTGLSWRVHLLPFLEEAELYRQFHLDEPWDRPHNMSLVERMPKAYGDDALGLTQLSRPMGIPAREDVLLVVVPEAAGEIWTKPGQVTEAASTIPEAIVLRDGRLLTVKPNASPADWQAWWQSSRTDALPTWLEAIPRPSKVQAVTANGESMADSTTALPLVLPAETWCAVSVQPRRLLLHPLRAAVYRTVAIDADGAAPRNVVQTWLGSYGARIRNGVAWLAQHQLEPEQLDSLTMVVPRKILSGPVNAAESFAVVCRAAGDFDVAGLLEAEMSATRSFEYREQGTTAGIVDLQRSLAIHFANDRTLLLGGQSLVSNLSEARPEDSRLTSWRHQAGSAPFVIALDAGPIHELLKQRPVVFPPPLQEWISFVMSVEGLVCGIDPDADNLATIRILLRQSSSAEPLKLFLLKQIEIQRAGLSADDHKNGDRSIKARLSALLEGLQMDAEGESLRITVKRPMDFDALVQSLLNVAP